MMERGEGVVMTGRFAGMDGMDATKELRVEAEERVRDAKDALAYFREELEAARFWLGATRLASDDPIMIANKRRVHFMECACIWAQNASCAADSQLERAMRGIDG